MYTSINILQHDGDEPWIVFQIHNNDHKVIFEHHEYADDHEMFLNLDQQMDRFTKAKIVCRELYRKFDTVKDELLKQFGFLRNQKLGWYVDGGAVTAYPRPSAAVLQFSGDSLPAAIRNVTSEILAM
jgi:hypothetical protein